MAKKMPADMKMRLLDREDPEPRAYEKVKAFKAIRNVGEKQKTNTKNRIRKAWNTK